MLKKGLFLSIIFVLIFSVGAFAIDYKYTQESGTGFFVGTADKADALEDSNELRQIINDLGALLVHSKMDGLYPKDLTTGGTIQIPEAGLKFSNAPVNDDIAAYIAGEMSWQTKAELSIQPLDATLTALAGLTIGANELIYGTGADAFAMLSVNADATNKFLRQISSGVPAWATLIAGDIPDISATYQPLDTALTNISALAYVSPSLIKLTATDTYAVRTLAEVKEDLSLNYVENLKVKLDGTQAPTVNNDVDEGYAVGSRWFDITNDKEYVCLDNTDGAAVWTETTGAAGGGTVDTSGTPVQYDIARFIDANTIEGRSYSEVKQDLDLEIDTDIQQDITNYVLCSDYDHPDDAITAISSANKTLLVTEAETCDTNFTVPANVTVKFERGGKWTINTGITVTFDGQIDAGLWQIFAYTGTGTLAGTINVREIYPQWWGASASAAAAVNATAFANALLMGRVIRVSEGEYSFDTGLDIPSGIKVIGDSASKTKLIYTGSGSYAISLGGNSIIRDLRITQSTNRTPERAALYIGNASNKVSNITIFGFRYGIKLVGDGVACAHNEIQLGYSWGCFYDIYLTALNDGYCNENHFWGGRLVASGDTGSYCIYINYYATNLLNGNRFFGTSMESGQKGVYCDGVSNSFISVRYENVLTDFHFGSHSLHNFVTGEMSCTVVDDSATQDQSIITSVSAVVPVINLKGGQITFPATQVPNAGVNVLDDYEEGTWTPVLEFGGASVGMTYSIQAGSYTKIGRQVTITGYIFLTAKGTSTGAVKVEGLPFACRNNDDASISVSLWLYNVSFADYPQAAIAKNESSIVLSEITNAGAYTTLAETNFANDSRMRFSATYFTD